MPALEIVRLSFLMQRSEGRPETVVALIDGPVATGHPGLSHARLRHIGVGSCGATTAESCRHATFVAGIVAGRRGSGAPAIASNCTFLVRPIFDEAVRGGGVAARPDELADALIDSVAAGAQVINLSLGLASTSSRADARLDEALGYAGRRGVLVVAASGNHASIGSTIVTRHPWVISVVACDNSGRPLGFANVGRSIAIGGVRAPGEAITSLDSDGGMMTASGTSAAAAFVTGAIALLWSLVPQASAAAIRRAIVGDSRRHDLIPPLLDAARAWQRLQQPSMV